MAGHVSEDISFSFSFSFLDRRLGGFACRLRRLSKSQADLTFVFHEFILFHGINK